MKAPAKPVAAPKLYDFLTGRADDDGNVEMGTRDIADAVGMGVSTVEHLFARWRALDIVRSVRRGGPFHRSIWWIDATMRDAAVSCSAVHPSHIGRHATRGAARGNVGGVEPPLQAPAPIRTRCPKCNLPPHHADCRHGWDGAMTRTMRRDAEAHAAAEIGRIAA
jgi:hypothetical protein